MEKMNAKKIVNALTNGGATYNKNGDAVTYKKGFQVSRKDLYTIDKRNVLGIVKATADALRQAKEREFVGVWLDSKTGLVYIDISERITASTKRISKKHAKILGKKRNQKSVYDWKKDTCYSC